ncbi:uncharacterized protein LOC130655659 [Hydractinia symbiolongicarpus]|uniref:uncharacterized protein LOC130655659 n=1 Tax=Hydractinia symbiolongicarpus TaxID=13093 RepID=UPI00254C3DE6|nr:uncharacterized protein LOC130655659 [Hydractinia symbiolongicarpus]
MMKLVVIFLCVALAYASFEEDFDDGSGGPEPKECLEALSDCRKEASNKRQIRICTFQWNKCLHKCAKDCHEAAVHCFQNAKRRKHRRACYRKSAACVHNCRL